MPNPGTIRNPYQAGKRAKQMGMLRVSPYYESELADTLFYAGYDGKKLEDVIAPNPVSDTSVPDATGFSDSSETV